MTSSPITKEQIKILHTLKSKLGMSEDDYRQMIMAHHADFATSSLGLSCNEAKALIEGLKAEAIQKGVWVDKRQPTETPHLKYDDLGNREGMASPKQLRMIEWLWAGKSFMHDKAKRAQALRQYCFRITKKQDLRFLESRDASKLIKSISSIKSRHTTASPRAEAENKGD